MSYDQFFKQAKKNTNKTSSKSPRRSSKKSSGGQSDQYNAAEALLKRELKQRSQSSKTSVHSDQGSAGLAALLRARKKARVSKIGPSKSQVHMMIGGACLLGFALCLSVFISPNEFAKTLGSVKIGIFSSATAQVSEKASQSKAKGGDNSSEDNGESKAPKVPDVKSWSTEELSFFANLNNRKLELDQREKDLQKLEEELQKKQVELDAKIAKLDEMRNEIAGVLKGKVSEDQERLKKLVQVYQNMKPVNAARVIASVDESLAIEILGQMKKREAAAILNFVEPKKARRLSEKFTGYIKD